MNHLLDHRAHGQDVPVKRLEIPDKVDRHRESVLAAKPREGAQSAPGDNRLAGGTLKQNGECLHKEL
jgi:hypothetical protein